MPKVSKIIEYRRARFLDPGHNLEALVREAWALFKTQLDRAVVIPNGPSVTGIAKKDEKEDGFSIHCARYHDKQGVGTISMIPSENIDLGEIQPDDTENFMKDDFFAIIKGNHIITLGCGRGAGYLRRYLYLLFEKANFEDDKIQFELTRPANIDALKRIKKIGVKSIDLKFDISKASASYLDELEEKRGIFSLISREIFGAFDSILSKDATLEELRSSEQGSLSLSINVKSGELAEARKSFDHLAEKIFVDDESEGYRITLLDNTDIDYDSLSIKKTIRINSYANSVAGTEAWSAMRSYMQELTNSGQLET